MSSYLNFYLVPKKSKVEEQKPLFIYNVSRNSELYQAINDSLYPKYISTNDDCYTELTLNNINEVINNVQEALDTTQKAYEGRLKAYKELKLEGDNFNDAVEDIASTKEIVEDYKQLLIELKRLSWIIESIEYSDFEKVLINID